MQTDNSVIWWKWEVNGLCSHIDQSLSLVLSLFSVFLNKLLGPSEPYFSCLQGEMRLHTYKLLEELRSCMSGACHCACHIGN